MAEYTDEQIEQNRRAWIAALRSGEYEQCRNELYDGTGYCCLGVAEQLFNGDPEEQNGYYRFSDPTDRNDRSVSVLTYRVQRLLGFSSENPGLKTDVPIANEETGEIEPIRRSTSLAELNDDYGFTFEQIADLIEERLDSDWEG